MQGYLVRKGWKQKSWMGLMDGEGSYHSIRLVSGYNYELHHGASSLSDYHGLFFPLRSTRLIQCPYLELYFAIPYLVS